MDGQVEAAEWVFLPQPLLLGRTADWVGLESPASRRGHVVGKTCPDCSATQHLNLLLPLFLRLDFLGGISKHLTTNLQDSGIPPTPPRFLPPVSASCFTIPENLSSHRASPSFPPSPTSRHHLLFSASWACHTFPAPTVSCPRFSGSWVRPGSALGVVVRTLAGSQCALAFPAVFLRVDRRSPAWLWSETGEQCSASSPIPHLGSLIRRQPVAVSPGGRGAAFPALGSV